AVPKNQNHPALNIVVVYEDFFTGAYAIRTVERLFQHGNKGRDLRIENLWQFDLLDNPKLREIAAAEAAKADLVIICARGSRELPSSIKRWLQQWLGKRADGQVAMVTLLDDSSQDVHQRSRLELYLEECAHRAGMGFFVQKTSPGKLRRFVILKHMP